MSLTRRAEQRLLSSAEAELVAPTHYPEICDLSQQDLSAALRRLREARDRARDISRQQRRESRGKAEPRGATAARDNSGTLEKAAALTAAIKRVKRELARVTAAEEAPATTQGDILRRALEMKRAARRQHHPSAGRSAGQGMRAVPNDGDRVQMDPREVGRVSQQVRAAQVRRDSA